MGDFLSKIENFLFDILGLVLPGLIFLIVLLFPIFIIDISKFTKEHIEPSYILSGLTTIKFSLSKVISTKNGEISNIPMLVSVTIISSYLLGHVVKVFSIIQYEFMTVIFDKSLNKFIFFLFDSLKKAINSLFNFLAKRDVYDNSVYKFFKTLFSPIKNTLLKIFTFKSPDYFSDNQPLADECVNIINARLNTNYPKKWYSVYKFSMIINSQENLKSLAGNFLAKYNLYRSLAFIFIFTIVYYFLFFQAASNYITNELAKVTSLILITVGLLWFTFHYKFKRYWTLCGNETLVSLYYFLNKKRINEN